MESTDNRKRKSRSTKRQMGLLSATSIGMGAMIGAGIFALVGIAVDMAGNLAYVSFFLAGILALLTAYSIAKLAVAFPKKGGKINFLNKGFGKGAIAGSLNIMTCLGYIVVTSLYARAFGEYGLALIGMQENSLLLHLLSSGIVVLFIGINFFGAATVGKAGLVTVAAQTGILLLFGIIGISMMDRSSVAPSDDVSISGIVLATGIIFMSYEGFGLVANTAEDIRRPKVNLPRALFTSVITVMVIYVAVNIAVIGNLSTAQILNAKDYVLAKAAEPMFGSYGFMVMGIAALFSTASAINSTIYGPVYMVQETSKAGQLPDFFHRPLWGHRAGTALVVAGVLILLLTNLLDMQSIAETGSLIFLVVYTAVNIVNYRLYKTTESKRWIVVLAVLSTAFALGALLYFLIRNSNPSMYVFGGVTLFSILFEIIYTGGREVDAKSVDE